MPESTAYYFLPEFNELSKTESGDVLVEDHKPLTFAVSETFSETGRGSRSLDLRSTGTLRLL